MIPERPFFAESIQASLLRVQMLRRAQQEYADKQAKNITNRTIGKIIKYIDRNFSDTPDSQKYIDMSSQDDISLGPETVRIIVESESLGQMKSSITSILKEKGISVEKIESPNNLGNKSFMLLKMAVNDLISVS